MRKPAFPGKRYHTVAPTVVAFADAAPVISSWMLRSFRPYSGRSLLRLDINGEEP